MTEATLPPVEKLDALLAAINRCEPSTQAEYVHEHVQEARTYALGAMPRECEWSLELARRAMASMPASNELTRARKLLDEVYRN